METGRAEISYSTMRRMGELFRIASIGVSESAWNRESNLYSKH